MMKFFTMEQLAAGIKERHVGAERARLVEKWSRTGLLRSLDGYKRETMAQLLENQAAQVLKEAGNSISTGGASGTSSGQIQGFSNIAFPIVRRVFGGLVANELVSIQPMSLPSGLIFYLDYTYGSNVGGNAGLGLSDSATDATYRAGQSIYNNPTGRGIQSGSLATGGMYDLVNTGFTRVQARAANQGMPDASTSYHTGSTGQIGAWNNTNGSFLPGAVVSAMSGTNAQLLNFDPQLDTALSTNELNAVFMYLNVADIVAAIPAGDMLSVEQIAVFHISGTTSAAGATPNADWIWSDSYQSGRNVLNLRRLNKRGNLVGTAGAFTGFQSAPLNGAQVQVVLRTKAQGTAYVPGALVGGTFGTAAARVDLSCAVADGLTTTHGDGGGIGSTLTIPSFESDFSTNPSPAIPEIDIKIESLAITATTRKLRARWSPELAQDLNAYHSMDAEVELTSILSEQIALEIDREILNDLVTEANGANMYWSRAPGKFVNKLTGAAVSLATSLSIGPQFTGTVREWYETLVETIIDCANTIHRKTLRGSANFMVTSPDVSTILESSVLYKPKYSIDGEGQVGSPFTIGAEAMGTLSNRFTVYKDPYFPRNRILVGYKGGSYLETGYVYSPYVPLIVTPTIFAPEDFTPRKGVMTRYGKKMVRSDFYGTITVLDMNII
jgi:hypothetical protein